MTISLKHTYQSAIPDSNNAALVQPSNWNAEHTLTLSQDTLVGRSTGGTGAAEEIACTSAGRALIGGATAEAQFNLLAPTTTRGDLIARGASTNGRLAIGANGKSLVSNGTDPEWGAPLGLVTPIMYGADPTGASDSSQAFTDTNATGLAAYVPPGTYLFTSAPTVSGTSWFISPGAIFNDPNAYPTARTSPTFLRDFWTNIGVGATVWRMPERLFVGAASTQDGSKTITNLLNNNATTWVTTQSYMGYYDTRSQFGSYSQNGLIAGAFASRSSDDLLTANRNCIGVASYIMNDNSNAAEPKSGWGSYAHAVHMSTVNKFTVGYEMAIANLSGATVRNTPYEANPDGSTGILTLGSGGETTEYIRTEASHSFTSNGLTRTDADIFPLSYGILLQSTTTMPVSDAATYPGIYYRMRLDKGIVFSSRSLFREGAEAASDTTETRAAIAMEMARGHVVRWKYGDGDNANQLSIRATGADVTRALIFDADSSGLLVKGYDAAFAEVPLFRLAAPVVSSGNSTNFLSYTPTQTGGGVVTLDVASSIDTDVTIAINPKGNRNVISTSGFQSSSATLGNGYRTGAGGTATQATSKSTGVTLNKVCGTITMNAASLAASTTVGFVLSNSVLAATDLVVVNIKSGATADSYVVTVGAVSSGSCRIELRNTTGGALAEAVVLSFAVIKAVAA